MYNKNHFERDSFIISLSLRSMYRRSSYLRYWNAIYLSDSQLLTQDNNTKQVSIATMDQIMVLMTSSDVARHTAAIDSAGKSVQPAGCICSGKRHYRPCRRFPPLSTQVFPPEDGSYALSVQFLKTMDKDFFGFPMHNRKCRE